LFNYRKLINIILISDYYDNYNCCYALSNSYNEDIYVMKGIHVVKIEKSRYAMKIAFYNIRNQLNPIIR